MATDGTGLIALDPWLAPYTQALRDRYSHYIYVRQRLDESGGLIGDASLAHLYFGLNAGEHLGKLGVWYREWAPGAEHMALIGDFNGWNREANPMERDHWGVWSTFLPDD